MYTDKVDVTTHASKRVQEVTHPLQVVHDGGTAQFCAFVSERLNLLHEY